MENVANDDALCEGFDRLSTSDGTNQSGSSATETPSPKCYYGMLSCLYGSLEPAVVGLLEQAVLHYRVRSFTKSLEIFSAFPPSQAHHPVIAYEHSLAHWHRWSLLDGERVLKESLAWGEAHEPESRTPGIYTLLRLWLGAIEMYTRGDFTTARDSMMELRGWLVGKPIVQYTQLEASPNQTLEAYARSNYSWSIRPTRLFVITF